jgi:uncharacterized SAM-binding protein YcdF (DUF218 family)
MFFLVSKLLTFLISPLIWILALLFYSLFSKTHARKRITLIAGIILLLGLSNSVIFERCMSAWEWPPVNVKLIKNTYEYGIVLGGMAGYDSVNKHIVFREGVDRLLQAVALQKRGIIKYIILTGGSGSLTQQEEKEAIHVKNYLNALGIPDDVVIIEPNSRNTRENALFTKNLIGSSPSDNRSLLITSAYHMRRSLACFEKAGLLVDPFPTDFYTEPRAYNFADFFIPYEGKLHDWTVLLHEIVGYLVYWVVGYI